MDKVTEKWLLDIGATAAEWEIFQLAKKFKRPFKNGDILNSYGTSRTNVRQHLERMMKKGLIVRCGYHTYIASKPV